MGDSNGNSSAQNGSKVDPLQRLPSFKAPRDLTLGAAKPNKKVFTPNLNVTRNKNKRYLCPLLYYTHMFNILLG